MLRTPLRKPREHFPSLTENDSCAVIKATRIDFSDILTNITLSDTVLFAGETFTLDKIIPDRATFGTHIIILNKTQEQLYWKWTSVFKVNPLSVQ